MISNTHTHTHTQTRCLACFEGEIEILTLMSAKKELIDQTMTTTTNFNDNVTAIEQSSSPVMIVTTQATTTTQTQITNNLHLNIQKQDRNRSYYQKKLDIINGYNADVIWKEESVRFEQDSSCGFKRFCQKCTRFEDLHLFDGQKRACKASLEELASKRRGNYKKDDNDDDGKDGSGGSLLK